MMTSQSKKRGDYVAIPKKLQQFREILTQEIQRCGEAIGQREGFEKFWDGARMEAQEILDMFDNTFGME